MTARISVCRELLDTSHHVAVVHVPAAHSERPLSQNALHVLAGASWRDVHHVRGHATRGNGAGVFQNPSLPVIGKVSPMGRAPCVGSKRGSADPRRVKSVCEVAGIRSDCRPTMR